MARLVSKNITPQDNPEEPKAGPVCIICGQRLTPSAYQRLLSGGIGDSVLCQTPGCPAVAYLQLSARGEHCIRFRVKPLY